MSSGETLVGGSERTRREHRFLVLMAAALAAVAAALALLGPTAAE